MQKCSFSEKVDAVQKYLLWKSRSILDIFILTSFLQKKIAGTSYSQEVTAF